jgi:hypothetical protein
VARTLAGARREGYVVPLPRRATFFTGVWAVEAFAFVEACLKLAAVLLDLVQSLDFGPIWQASDPLSLRVPESAHRPVLNFTPQPLGAALETPSR